MSGTQTQSKRKPTEQQQKLDALCDRANPLQDRTVVNFAHLCWCLEQIRDGKQDPEELAREVIAEEWTPHCMLSYVRMKLMRRSMLCRKLLDACREAVLAPPAAEIEIYVVCRPGPAAKEDGP